MAKAHHSSFLVHAVIYGAGAMLLQAASVILLPLYTRYLSPADFGVLEILNRTADVLTVFLMANGLSGAAFTFYCQAKTEKEKAGIAATVNLVAWLGILAGLLITFLGADFLSELFMIHDRRLTILGLCAGISQLLLVMPLSLAQARVESVVYILASLLTLFLRLGVIVIGVVVCRWGIWGVLWGTLVSSVASGVLLTLREFWKTGFRPDFALLPAVLRFAWPFIPGGLCNFVLFGGDRYFLLKHAGAEEVGVYSLGYKLAMCVAMVGFTPLFKVWSARMYEVYPRPDGSVQVGRVFTRILASYVVVGFGLCLFQTEVLRILGTPAYLGATRVMPSLVVAFGFLQAQVLLDGALYVYRFSGYKLAINVLATVVIAVLYVLLIPPYGALGAAFAALGAFATFAIATYVVSQRIFRVQYEWGRLVAMIGLTMLLAAPAYWLGYSLFGSCVKLGLFAAWPVLLWSLGVVTREEKQFVREALARLARALRLVRPLELGVPDAADDVELPQDSSASVPTCN